MNTQVEGVWEGAESLCSVQVHHSSSTATWPPTEQLFKPQPPGILWKVFSHRDDQSLTPLADPLPPLEKGMVLQILRF